VAFSFTVSSFKFSSPLCVGNGDGAKVNDKSNTKKMIILSSVLSTGTLLLFLAMVLYIRNRKQQRNSTLLSS